VIFYYCDYDEGPCIVSERAFNRIADRKDAVRCVAHGCFVNGIIRGPGGEEPENREEARKFLGVPFRKLYDRRWQSKEVK